MKKKYLIIIIVILIIALCISLYLIFKKDSSNNGISLDNSYLFASPLQIKADGKEKIRLTIFVLDTRGLGVANKTVSISTSSKLNITNVQNKTDDYGRAVFDLTSTTTGQFDISAQVEKSSIPQKAKIVFN